MIQQPLCAQRKCSLQTNEIQSSSLCMIVCASADKLYMLNTDLKEKYAMSVNERLLRGVMLVFQDASQIIKTLYVNVH